MKAIGTELYDQGLVSVIKECEAFLKKDENLNYLVSPSDANVLVLARTSIEFRKVVDDFYWNLPDGMPSVWLLKLKGSKEVERICGYEFFEQVIKATANLPINHYLLGGADGVAKELETVCNSWGNHNICGTYCPPYKNFDKSDYLMMSEKVKNADTDVLWVALGAPKQLYFAHHIQSYLQVKMIAPIGAAFDFHVGRVPKAPDLMQILGLEWFYRLYKEPKRLFRRYAKVVPLFIYYGILDYFKKD